jgi:cell division protease FtsH
MVTEFGMSSKLGRINYSDRSTSPFLGTSLRQEFTDHSEATSCEIDHEVRRIVDKSSQLARSVLEGHRVALKKLALRLLEKEVLDAEELKEIMDESGPRLVPGTMPEDGAGGSETDGEFDEQTIDADADETRTAEQA